MKVADGGCSPAKRAFGISMISLRPFAGVLYSPVAARTLDMTSSAI
jgi:hypothetical protein